MFRPWIRSTCTARRAIVTKRFNSTVTGAADNATASSINSNVNANANANELVKQSQKTNKKQNKKKNVNDKTTILQNAALNNFSIATKQQLYMLHKYSPGSVFFLPNGAKLFNKLIEFIKLQETKKLGFNEVITPLIYKKDLFEVSNHWKYYNEDMFKIYRQKDATEVVEEQQAAAEAATEIDASSAHQHDHHHETENSHESESSSEEIYGLKPMNCPGHCLIYKQFPKSYNELPVKYSDFSSLHRNEASGALSGLTRVRRFHQDDGHIFCSFDHLEKEILQNLQLIELVYKQFGLNDFKILLSTRPKNNKFIGEAEEWEKAEGTLVGILDKLGKKWELNEGDGAFYGPKIDIILQDRFAKFHQTATIQLDFQLPKRFGLEFTKPDGTKEVPIIIHRAIFGSVERFLAILIDHFGGKWPFWLNSNQAKIIPVSPEKHLWYAEYVKEYLLNNGKGVELTKFKNAKQHGEAEKDSDKFNELSPLTMHEFNIHIDDRAEPIGKRIKDAYKKSYNYLITIGDEEVANETVALKNLYTNEIEKLPVEKVLEKFIDLEKNYE